MSDGCKNAHRDQEDYIELCRRFDVAPRGLDLYSYDYAHKEELWAKARKEDEEREEKEMRPRRINEYLARCLKFEEKPHTFRDGSFDYKGRHTKALLKKEEKERKRKREEELDAIAINNCPRCSKKKS